MLDLQLFLGFSVDSAFETELKKANPYLVSLMIGKAEYLLEIAQNGKKYLGKKMDAYPSIAQIKDLETHLLSLLRKLAPQYPLEHNHPVLLTCSHGN